MKTRSSASWWQATKYMHRICIGNRIGRPTWFLRFLFESFLFIFRRRSMSMFKEATICHKIKCLYWSSFCTQYLDWRLMLSWREWIITILMIHNFKYTFLLISRVTIKLWCLEIKFWRRICTWYALNIKTINFCYQKFSSCYKLKQTAFC